MPYPPYSPDTAPGDHFFWFPRIKKVLTWKHFAIVEEVKHKPAEALKDIEIDRFKNCCEQWKKCFNRCIASNEEYFEGD